MSVFLSHSEFLLFFYNSLGICAQCKRELAFGSIPETLTYDLQHLLNETKENKQKNIFEHPQRLSPLTYNFRLFQFLLLAVLGAASSHSAFKFI